MRTPDYLQAELLDLAVADATLFNFLHGTVLDGLWYWDLQAPENGWVNSKLWLTLGHDAQHLPPEPNAWQAALLPADFATMQQVVAAKAADAACHTFSQVLRFHRLDGSEVWMDCRALLLRNEAGTATRLVGALLNITREVEKEAYAVEIANHYSTILSNQSVYIIKTDAAGNYTYVNDLFYERFGYDAQIIGTSSLNSIIEEDRPKCLDVVAQCFVEPEVPHQVILRKPYNNGPVKSNHWEFKGLVDEQGQVTEILCVGYDVTLLTENLQKSQHLLEVTKQQNLRLQNFAYIISHNIRSHSANLTSLAKLLDGNGNADQKAIFLQMLNTSTAKLAETIANLNDIVTINTQGAIAKEPRLLKEEIIKTLDALNVQIRQHQIRVEVDVPADLLVPVVPAYLDSILLNLLSNAVKYRATERPAFIRLYTYQEPGFIVLAVQDNGLGIDLNRNRNKVFGMYKTFHNNDDARGMGLFISKNQVEAMQGRIEIESQTDVGSTFKVFFSTNVDVDLYS
ncbi:sensor histidine kinase [Hymenobacter arizonensis]|uniref:histidine kinase n=1 Tax=Hymenobacter arizonensis TaxID=1227077 RepID=A0A1I5SWX9_HYMAR|nr:ATP-binding protein [Hymenobacter arizonensis]SFP75151.1 PAS domain S-box-containing protein [Hymenobacter arizonensis]